jgi:glycosyltransferase involved in cell wall biosynthesis
MPRIVFVLWNGVMGGAESLSLELARRAREIGHDASLVFIAGTDPMSARAEATGVPFTSVGVRSGSQVIRHPRRYADTIRALSPDLVISMSVGQMAWPLRLGGYRGPLVGVEHGVLLQYEARGRLSRTLRRVDRLLAARTLTAEVAVSSFMRAHCERVPHARVLKTIPNGVDVQRFKPSAARPNGETVFGFAGRLVPGKGIEVLLDAFAALPAGRLRIAGDGPLIAELALRARGDVQFVGSVSDMPEFWQSVDVAVAPSDGLTEAFGMAPLEAMACGRPAIVTDNGGLVDLIEDGFTGSIVPRGDVEALACALRAYLDSELVEVRGAAARASVVTRFSLDASLASYVALADAHEPGPIGRTSPQPYTM